MIEYLRICMSVFYRHIYVYIFVCGAWLMCGFLCSNCKFWNSTTIIGIESLNWKQKTKLHWKCTSNGQNFECDFNRRPSRIQLCVTFFSVAVVIGALYHQYSSFCKTRDKNKRRKKERDTSNMIVLKCVSVSSKTFSFSTWVLTHCLQMMHS